MTVKLQNGNVILKDGKVACSCCGGPPGECCMYPVQALLDGLYSYQDLPDTVIGNGTTPGQFTVMTKLNPPQPSIDRSNSTSYYRGFTVVNNVPVLMGIGLVDGFDSWVGSEVANEDADFGPCLISRFPASSPLGIGDEFADTYSWLSDDPFAGDPYNPVSTTVTRVSLCRWEGPLLPFAGGEIFCRPVLYLHKGQNAVFLPIEYAFVWRMQWEGDQADTGGDKIGFDNTPVGEYDADPTPGTWVIS